ncbi:MAG: hypothetical protein WCJ55_19565 [Chloroflexales bacterium]
MNEQGIFTAAEFAHLNYEAATADFRAKRAAGMHPGAIVKAWRDMPPASSAPTSDATMPDVTDTPILLARHITGMELGIWLQRFRAAQTPAERRAVLARFVAECPPPPAGEPQP